MPNKVHIDLCATHELEPHSFETFIKNAQQGFCALEWHQPAKINETQNWPSRNLRSNDPDFSQPIFIDLRNKVILQNVVESIN